MNLVDVYVVRVTLVGVVGCTSDRRARDDLAHPTNSITFTLGINDSIFQH